MKDYEQTAKKDADKLRYELIPPEALEAIAEIVTYGAKKYSPGNWRTVRPFNDRYYGALMRHLQEWRKGALHDPESGFHHLKHALCCLVFLVAGQGEKDDA